ncbi:LLM class F420-dependent oxidoreductase [Desertibaculum subflavum]|uniref:LLM class F420-dependent oxidoreductase n=1 Tax=Desertibaculum subflavum TaxID=2268458 RepID=UPI000E671EB7
MKFGLRYCNTGPYVDPAKAVELAQAAEEAGFESMWTVEHTVVPAGYGSAYPYAPSGKMAGGNDAIPLPDPLIWMAYVAAATRRIKLGTAILILPQHNPVVVAKQVATLDHLSGGRILLGIGAGWLKEEFEALGVPFETRGRRTDEYIKVLRELWGAEKPTFQGEFVRFKDTYCRPQPVNKHVPIIVGGHSEAAAKRAGRLGDGFFPARGAPAELFDLARRSAEEAGRDPNAIEMTVGLPDDLAQIPSLVQLGVQRILVPVSPMAGLNTVIASPADCARWKPIIEQYAD